MGAVTVTCPSCGKGGQVAATYLGSHIPCPGCGTSVPFLRPDGFASASAVGYPVGGQQYGNHQAPPPFNGKAVASLVLGIANFLILPLVGAILALALGYAARNELRRDPQRRGAGMATAGVVLGWVGIAVVLLILMPIFLWVTASFLSGG